MRHELHWADGIARRIDLYRVVPRVALAAYMVQMWRVGEWAMSLHDLSAPQTVFISTIYGVFPLLLNFYMQQGPNWGPAAVASGAGATASASITPAPKGA